MSARCGTGHDGDALLEPGAPASRTARGAGGRAGGPSPSSSKLQSQMARLSGLSPRQVRAWATANRPQLVELGRRFAARAAMAREAQAVSRRVEEETAAARRRMMEENVSERRGWLYLLRSSQFEMWHMYSLF